MPIGLLIQVSDAPSRYRVLGLGKIATFENDFFCLGGPCSLQTAISRLAYRQPGRRRWKTHVRGRDPWWSLDTGSLCSGGIS